ncbi:NADH-ubiquinone oxidoreductase-F iron-sulfur binding region domain-containing protein [Clostridium thailandense]|uniref:NADH-ubiquinone oxidoreductase-F iron-sulfur binding region domain-containing protein n=1 Tax=Clostridium thailandense TaxID=2794346 RepID=UPI003989BEE1
MGILKNGELPLTALINAKKIGREAVIETVKAVAMREYGVYSNRFVADEWNVEGYKPEKIIGALNNNDTEHMLLVVLKKNIEAVLEGLAIAAYANGIEDAEIILPKEDDSLTKSIESLAKKYDITVTVSYGIVDVASEKNSIIHHLETAAAITSLFEDIAAYKRTFVAAVKKADKSTEEPIESLYGRTLGDIIVIDEKEEIKAISVGSKIYESSALDMLIEEDFSLQNGVITIFNTKKCMADQAEKAILEVRKAGCGKCTFCREGALQIHTMMKDITQGKGKNTDIAMIKEIGEVMNYSCLCSIGQTGANFILGALKYFGEEIEAHICKKRCPTDTCSAFMNIYIDPSSCDGCGDCLDVCPVNCIEGKAGYIHMIDEFDCTKCGKCAEVCSKGAVVRTTGRLPKLPERLTKVGRFKKR